ncbi:MAG: putative solute-binding component of transporter [Ramlibacter sp.]|nr:putative solute-binding component of transporter [Ramlibacter sp.]
MRASARYLVALAVTLAPLIAGPALGQRLGAKGSDTDVVQRGEGVPPRVVPPCAPGKCPFAGQTVSVVVSGGNTIAGPIHELKVEYEQATGARLNIVELPIDEHFAGFISDATNRGGKFDISMAGAWWLGELVEADFILPLDRFYKDPRFPHWDMNDVLPAPRSLLTYAGKLYMVANDHDGQVMYYRRDLFSDPGQQAAFRRKYGYPLAVPQTWAQFRDAAEFFDGQDLNADGTPDHGITLALGVGSQGMFHFMSMSAPFVVGPGNQKLYWFDPKSMAPLVDSPGHVRALEVLVDLTRFGPREMQTWDLGRNWDYFLAGRAALTFSWADLGALAQQPGSRVKGKIGVAPMPGTTEYYSQSRREWVKTRGINKVGNTIGGSWAGVISRSSKAPEAAYYLLALMAHKEKALVYAARGWDGIDPGRYSQFLPPAGTARIEQYLGLGWDAADIRDYLGAYAESFGNSLQFPYLRIPGAFSYCQALDVHLAEATSGQLSPAAALKATAIDFEEITLRMGRTKQRKSYQASLQF